MVNLPGNLYIRTLVRHPLAAGRYREAGHVGQPVPVPPPEGADQGAGLRVPGVRPTLGAGVKARMPRPCLGIRQPDFPAWRLRFQPRPYALVPALPAAGSPRESCRRRAVFAAT